MDDMEEKTFFTDEHSDHLPTVRIKKAILKDFKSVSYGEITFNCGRQFIPCNTESDILGVYGQNGSGKTSFIEALSILQELLSGSQIEDAYVDCIDVDKDYADLEFVFDLQYPDGKVREATYAFSIARKDKTPEEIREKYKRIAKDHDVNLPESEKKAVVFNEKFYLKWEDASKKQLIIDTTGDRTAFVPDAKRKLIVGGGKSTLVSLEVNKRIAYNESKSFVFMGETLSLFEEFDNKNVFFQVLAELRWFGLHYLFVIDTKSSGFIRLNLALPIFTTDGMVMLDIKNPMTMPNNKLEDVKKDIENISYVLSQLVPGLTISIKVLSETITKKGNPGSLIMLVADRNGKELPLRDESDGVRKIISVLSLITAAFNEKSVTVAIDEFDAGIFEYLLGEILQSLEESGKGQFIFTSHNLRPLEVIDKKFLYFTTTNPNNRYIRLKNIGSTNNLRDTYFREIILNEQDEQIYNHTKRFKIIAALKKAGGIR